METAIMPEMSPGPAMSILMMRSPAQGPQERPTSLPVTWPTVLDEYARSSLPMWTRTTADQHRLRHPKLSTTRKALRRLAQMPSAFFAPSLAVVPLLTVVENVAGPDRAKFLDLDILMSLRHWKSHRWTATIFRVVKRPPRLRVRSRASVRASVWAQRRRMRLCMPDSRLSVRRAASCRE